MEDVLIDAQALAQFSNLNPDDQDPLSSANTDHFRHNHPRFIPENWWRDDVFSDEETPLPNLLWKVAQRHIQDAWKKGFAWDLCVWLINLGVLVPTRGRFPQLSRIIDGSKAWPYQRAIFFLAINGWRAKFCARCGNRFVAATAKSIYCSDACFQSARKDSKKAWWTEHGTQWRDKRTKSKRSK